MAITAEQFKGKVTIADGAWGTELDKLGCPAGYCREEWNLAKPDTVRKVPEAYVAAGAQIILSNTFGANRITLAKHKAESRVREINRAGARISKEAAADKALVFASIGPSGKMVMMGEVKEQELFDAYKEQAEALAEGGADALVVETMTELAEATAAVRAAKTTGLLVVGCMTFDSGRDKTATVMGVTAEKAATELTQAGADIVGCNCGIGIENYIKVAAKMRQVVSCPIWVKANAGLPEIDGASIVYRMTPEEFAARSKELVAAGANIIGGCCGTTPEFTRALSNAYKA
jgi:methionine synthase I (cobalamin-dependent)